MNGGRIAFGVGLIALAVIPTPDDVTVISPLAQFIGGSAMIISGLIDKDDKK